MKQLKITVNGITYDVAVEEVGATSVAAPVATPAAAPATAPAAPVAEAPAAAPAAAPQVADGEGEPVLAPMPGTILSIAVNAGQAVKKGDVLCVLEAMKMENEIFSPRDAVVSAVTCARGESVDAGKSLVILK
ncbi:MAG: biotin/lipoyl-binding protein [Clostridia bacterium]|nr:biotin/lipoyl-binding protein [Clostridia bacterium]